MEDKKKSTAVEPSPYAPRKLTFAENAMLTVKVLGALGLIGAVVWGISLWTSPQ
jgi:hypothetical protein